MDDAIDELLPRMTVARLQLRGHADVVKSSCFDPHHRLLFTASWDGMVLGWNLEMSTAPVARLPHREWVNAVATTYVPDLTVISVTEDGYMFGWQCEQLLAEASLGGTATNAFGEDTEQQRSMTHQKKFEIVAQIQVAHGALTTLAIHSDFNFAFTSCGDTTFGVHLSSGSVLREYVTQTDVTCLAAIDAVLCIAQQSGTITIYDIVASFIIRQLNGHRGPVRCMSVIDAYSVMSGGEDCSIRVWNIASGSCQSNRRRVHTRPITSLTHFYTERDRMVVSSGLDGVVKITRQSNGTVVASYGLLCTCVCVIPPLNVDPSNVEEILDMLSGGRGGTGATPEFGRPAGKLWEEPQLEYTASAVYNMKSATEQDTDSLMPPMVIPGTDKVICDTHISRHARWSFFQTLICGGHSGRISRLSMETISAKDSSTPATT